MFSNLKSFDLFEYLWGVLLVVSSIAVFIFAWNMEGEHILLSFAMGIVTGTTFMLGIKFMWDSIEVK